MFSTLLQSLVIPTSLFLVTLGLQGGLAPLIAAEADTPTFLLRTAGGAAFQGPVEELGESWRVRLRGPKPVRTEADDLIELRRIGQPLPPLPDGEQLILVNGDHLPGSVLRLTDERLQFRPRLSTRVGEEKPWNVPVSALALIWLGSPDDTPHADVLRRRLLAGKRNRDVVYLRNGDSVEGVLTSLDEKVVQVEADKQVLDIKRERVAVVALNTELASALRPKGAYGRLVLATGARLALVSASCADGLTLVGETLFKGRLEIPLSEIAALYLHQGKAAYLSDLKPKQYEHTPYLPTSLAVPFVTDGSFRQHDLRVAGGTYDKGLGVHSACRLTYDLAGNYRRFEALVGLDDRTGQRGSVRIRVLVDGKPQQLGEDRELTARAAPLALQVNVAGAKELTLVVEFGQGGDVQDDVNWVDARLVR